MDVIEDLNQFMEILDRKEWSEEVEKEIYGWDQPEFETIGYDNHFNIKFKTKVTKEALAYNCHWDGNNENFNWNGEAQELFDNDLEVEELFDVRYRDNIEETDVESNLSFEEFNEHVIITGNIFSIDANERKDYGEV